MFAHLNSNSDVVAKSTTDYTLAQAQVVNPDIMAIISNAPDGLMVKGQETPDQPYYHRHLSGAGTAIGDYSAITVLLPLKIAKAAAIDARTEELIDAGFVASNGKRFKIDDCNMTRYHVMYAIRLHVEAVYPVVITTHDGQNAQTLSNNGMVASFAEEMFLGQQAILASGSALKQQLIVASTLAEVEAVVDNR
jgi:hypothetical protein